MEVQLTAHQLRIAKIAGERLRQLCPNDSVTPMFRGHRRSLSVGLCCSDAGQNYIVREVIPWFSTRATIEYACCRIVTTMAGTYSKVSAKPFPFQGTGIST